MSRINRLTIPVATLPSSQRLIASQLAESSQSRFNAFSDLYPLEETLAAADESDKRHREGETKGILDGIPISIKSNISVQGKYLTACSDSLDSVMGYDSYVARKLKESGAILIGSTTMDEFGMGSLGNNCNTGYTANPIPHMSDHSFISSITDRSIDECIKGIESLSLPNYVDEDNIVLSPGGSSSGSAVSVALGASLASIGTDTGGS